MESDRMAPDEWIPDDLREALGARSAVVIRRWNEGGRTYLFADSSEGPLFGRASRSTSDRAVLAHEVAVRKLIGSEGVLRTPPVVASGIDWVLEVAVESQPLRGQHAMDAVVDAVQALQSLSLPDPPSSPERPSLFATFKRRLTLVRTGLRPTDLIAARKILREETTPDATSHGDFHVGNVFLVDGALSVVDWEMVGRRPSGYDLMQLWASIEGDNDRSTLFRATVAMVGSQHEYNLAQLRYALLVKTIADKLGATRDFNRDVEGGRRLLTLLPEARRAAH